MRLVLGIVGIALLVNRGAGAQPRGWRLSPEPRLEIGSETEPQAQFDGISGAIRMQGGEIVVANSGTQELRVFSPAGAHLVTLSRKGRGPGELEHMFTLWRAGDTAIALNANVPRSELVYFTMEGPAGRVTLPRFGGGAAAPIGRFTSGRWAVEPGGMSVVREVAPPAIVDDSTRVAVATSGKDSSVVLIGSFVRTQLLLFSSPFRPGAPFPAQYVFGHGTRFAVSGDLLWIGDTDSGEIGQWNDRGTRVASFAAPGSPRPINPAVIHRLLESRPLEATNPVQKAVFKALYSAPLPKRAPRFGEFVAGVDGEMWIERYEEDPAVARSYDILDKSGKVLGSTSLPVGFRIFDVGRDYVLGVRIDNDGVEHVALYGLERAR